MTASADNQNRVADPAYGTDMMDEQTSGLLGVVVVLRTALIVWASIVVIVDVAGVTEIHSGRAAVLLIVLVAWTATFAWLLHGNSTVLMSIPLLLSDTIISAIAAAADPIVYPGPHPQSFSSAWPLSGAVVAGIVRGPATGAGAGFLIGATGAISVSVVSDGGLSGKVLGSVGTIVLLTVSGWLAGVLSNRMRQAELTRARAQIREETARRLHDGVLQTLAVIQRRSNDAELIRLARDQEADLRSFIAVPKRNDPSSRDEGAMSGDRTISGTLRATLSHQQRRFGLAAELVVVDEPGVTPANVVDAITGAVAEAVANASRHGDASTVWVFVDHETGILRCEVRDDGSGFDPQHMTEGTGITRSMRGRIEEVHGELEITSSPGRGVTVLITVPIARSAEGSRGPKRESIDEQR